MNTEIEQYERIQEYLRGRMSDEDRAAFESDLSTDGSLREQYEDLRLLARSIKKANQEVDLRMAIEESEKQLSESSITFPDEALIEEELNRVERELKMMGVSAERPKPGVYYVLKDRVKGAFRAVGQWFIPTGYLSTESKNENTVSFSLSYASRLAISFAVAASLALAIILPYNAKIASSGYELAPSQLYIQIYRGGSPDLLEEAVNFYNKEAYDDALSYLEDVKTGIESTLSQLGNSDSDVAVKRNLTNELYRVDWYRALALMKTKKVKKAKRALRAISESESPFAKKAHDYLDAY